MEKLKPVVKVTAVGLTTLVAAASGLLSLPSLERAFADQNGWLHEHLSPEQATAIGGVLLALGLCLLYVEVRDRGLKPRKGVAATAFLWVVASLGLIFFAPNRLELPEEIGIGPAEALPAAKGHVTAEGHSPRGKSKGQDAGSPASTEPVALVEESSDSQSTPSANPSSSRSGKGSCTCPAPSPAPAPTPAPTRQPEETVDSFAQEERREEAEEAREEEQEAAEEAREEEEFAREEAELGI